MKSIIHLEDIFSWSQQFIDMLEQRDSAMVITLSGDLGAGKTTITQSIAQILGIKESVTSPTFVIQKEYMVLGHAWIKKLVHIDAYRLERKEDLEYLGWNEIIQNPENLIIIEWPEMVAGIEIPEPIKLYLTINTDLDYTRTIRIEK